MHKDTQLEAGEPEREFTHSGFTACVLIYNWNPEQKTDKSGAILVAAGVEWPLFPPLALRKDSRKYTRRIYGSPLSHLGMRSGREM